MPRARMLKYEFFRNESLGYMPPHARLLFAGLWCLADKAGRLEDRPGMIKGYLFGFENDVTPEVVDDLLTLLDDADLIRRYHVEDGRYISIVKWTTHQHPHPREVASKIPEPTKERSRHGHGHTHAKPRHDQGDVEAMNGHGRDNAEDMLSPSMSSMPSMPSMPSIKTKGTNGDSGKPARAREQAPHVSPTRPGSITQTMRKANITGATPSNPRIVALADTGVTLDLVSDACEEAHRQHPDESISAAYVCTILERWQREPHHANGHGHENGHAPVFDERAKDRKRAGDELTGRARRAREAAGGDVIDVAMQEIGHEPRHS
ncbi:hypothetical protein OKW41_002102 [Paraburkholderia sp. UCT70]|uniref:hypothetical protein n=1 Tax=Paraburkholderia sp. UCT70 TaxID=2991068 RepID=UPI003D1A1E3E